MRRDVLILSSILLFVMMISVPIVFSILQFLPTSPKRIGTIQSLDTYQAPNSIVNDGFWNKTLGGLRHDSGRAVVECNSGGFAIGGTTASYGPGDMDMWLVRLDASGNVLWNRTYDTQMNDFCESMIECEDGGFALIGSTGEMHIWRRNVLVIRTNATGHVLWNRTFGNGGSDYGYSIVECNDGGFAIAAATSSFGAGWNDMVLLKINGTGIPEWANFYGGPRQDEAYDVIELQNGDFALVGYTDSFGEGGPDVWVVRTNATGYNLWNHTYGGSSWDKGYSIVELESGDLVITGFTESYGAGVADVWLLKVNSLGIPIWQPTIGGSSNDEGNCVFVCQDGGFAIAGYTDSYGAGLSDMWLIRANTEGEAVWTLPIGGEEYELGYSVIECSDGSFLLVGQTGTSYLGEQNLFVVHVPENPPTTPTTPTIPTGPIDLGFLLTIIIPVAGVGIALSVILVAWRRRIKGK